MKKAKIAIVGAGITGLACSYYLEKAGYHPDIYEASGKVGGRIKTDKEHGCLLDHGFQVILSSYPEVKRIFSHNELSLHYYPAGAKVRVNGKWQTIFNPFKHPLSFFMPADQTIATREDQWKLAKIYFKHGFYPVAVLDESPESTNSYLKSLKLSDSMIENFLRPFFGGVFFDLDLLTSKDIFTWILRYFVEGRAGLPTTGMQALPNKLHAKLSKSQLFLNTEVAAVEGQSLYIAGGVEKKYDKIVLATDLPHLQLLVPSTPARESQQSICLYFMSHEKVAKTDNFLYLNNSDKGPINNLSFPNHIQPTYAPAKYTLASVTVLSREYVNASNLVEQVLDQLNSWFPTKSQPWQHIKTYSIPHALPDQRTPPPLLGYYQVARLPDIYICGEAVDQASINGSLFSGRRVAEILQKKLATSDSPKSIR